MKLKSKLIAITAICLVTASIFSISALAEKDVPSLKVLIKGKQAQFDDEFNKMDTMTIQSKEDQDVRNQLGHKTKSLGSEIRKLQLEADPDDTENFAKQLEESIGNLTLCVLGFKQDAVRYNDDKYLKQAEEVEKRIEKLKKGKEQYQKNEKTVKQLRKELDIPVL